MRERQRIYRKRNGNMSFVEAVFHSVSIKERENPKCQQAHLPFRYRGEMTEFSCAEDKIGL